MADTTSTTTTTDPATNPANTDPTNTDPTNTDPATQTTASEQSTELETLKATNTTYENTLKTIFGVKDGEELGDVAQRMADYNKAVETKSVAVNDRIITAEIKSLQGYDSKLLAKVIDRTDIKVSDDGTVTGLTEAITAAEKEYPAVVQKTDKKTYAPLNPVLTDNSGTTMNDLIRGRR